MSYHDINTMGIERLLYEFERRMHVLLKQESKKHMMDACPSWILDKIEEEIMPAVEYINNWEPTDDEINNYGEPPMTMAEMHEIARQQKREAWK